MTTRQDNIMYVSHLREMILSEPRPAYHKQYRIEDGSSHYAIKFRV